jgi:nitrite reductase/ring-hydroxylating ferredoxin subunit
MQEDFMDEGFVFHRDGEVYAFRNRCAHVTLPLDLDDEDFFSDDEDGDYIVCKSHGAKYLPKTGICVDGPCKGKSLRKLNVQVLDNYVYLNTQETPLSEKKNTSSSKERKVVKIVLTGGPCGGKSTALSKVTSALTNSGVRVLTVPEAATILFSNGFKPSDPLQMQTAITQTQILLEVCLSEFSFFVTLLFFLSFESHTHTYTHTHTHRINLRELQVSLTIKRSCYVTED